MEDKNCKCYAGRERPGLLKKIEDLEASNKKLQEKVDKLKENEPMCHCGIGYSDHGYIEDHPFIDVRDNTHYFDNPLNEKIRRQEDQIEWMEESGKFWGRFAAVKSKKVRELLIQVKKLIDEITFLTKERDRLLDLPEYKKREFCYAVHCEKYFPAMQSCGKDCIKTAWEFHDWLKQNGYKIVKKG